MLCVDDWFRVFLSLSAELYIESILELMNTTTIHKVKKYIYYIIYYNYKDILIDVIQNRTA